MDREILDAIRARWPVDGEWWFRDGTTVKTLVDGGEEVIVAECVGESESAVRDAEFISHAFRDIYHLLAYVDELETLLDEVRALVGPDNESGMISASAIFHTIGTGNQGDDECTKSADPTLQSLPAGAYAEAEGNTTTHQTTEAANRGVTAQSYYRATAEYLGLPENLIVEGLKKRGGDNE